MYSPVWIFSLKKRKFLPPTWHFSIISRILRFLRTYVKYTHEKRGGKNEILTLFRWQLHVTRSYDSSIFISNCQRKSVWFVPVFLFVFLAFSSQFIPISFFQMSFHLVQNLFRCFDIYFHYSDVHHSIMFQSFFFFFLCCLI